MDIFCEIKYSNIASNIKENKYSETNQITKTQIVQSDIKKTESKTLIDEIFSKNDIEYDTSSHQDLYREKIKIEIATKIDEVSDNYYDNFNYKKTFSIKKKGFILLFPNGPITLIELIKFL